MRLIFTLLLILSFKEHFGQVTIDKNLNREFQQFIKQVPENVSNKRNVPNLNKNALFILSWRNDTLDKQDYQPDTISTGIMSPFIDSSVKDDKSKRDEPQEKSKKNYEYWVQPCHSTYSKDTLIVRSVYGSDYGDAYTLKLINGLIYINYEYIATYQPGYFPSKIESVTLQNLSLNSLPTKMKQTFFGKATFTVDKEDQQSEEFKHGYVSLKRTISFMFTSTLE